jgi:hypothetical protein
MPFVKDGLELVIALKSGVSYAPGDRDNDYRVKFLMIHHRSSNKNFIVSTHIDRLSFALRNYVHN